MNNLLIAIGCAVSLFCFDSTMAKTKLDNYQQYRLWYQQIPEPVSPEFLSFIKQDSPLAQRLRNKWLYQLADKKNWFQFLNNYRESTDVNLQCYYRLSQFYQGQEVQALKGAESLWLVGKSQPKVCNKLFSLLLNSENFDESLIRKRIILALHKRNLNLARYLLKQFKNPRLEDSLLLLKLYRNPGKITELKVSDLHDEFYLYGLKRMVSRNMDKSIRYWHHVKTKQLLSQDQQQAFLAHVALYKSMRGHSDSYEWYKKVRPDLRPNILIEWQIRAALKNKKWKRVERLINSYHEKDEMCWQYWLARSYEAQGQKIKAQGLYEILAKSRHYYGFLASQRIDKTMQFENEPPIKDLALLSPYGTVLEEVKGLHEGREYIEAFRVLRDLATELSKEEASALAYWVANELKWPEKALYLSNSGDKLHNQLALRFPLSHRETVRSFAKNYNISPEFVYAIIRQESAFRPKVISRVGARGLMQIMPKTAKMVARKEKIPFTNQVELFHYNKNINIGVAYLNRLSKRFDNHPTLIAAAYNAGPRQVNHWLKNHSPKAVDIWVETLPWHETRNYLKNVMAFYAVYQYRLNKKPDLDPFLKPIE